MRTDTRSVRRRDWTDVAFLIGPTMRWVEDDYPRLNEAYPEVLLGYQVRFATYGTLDQETRGRAPGKVVVLDGEGSYYPPQRLFGDLAHLEALGAQVEYWHVHGSEVYRI